MVIVSIKEKLVKVMVGYDSTYGNTEKIARSIASGFAATDEVKVMRVNEISAAGLNNFQLLVIGSPTLGGRASQPVQQLLAAIPDKHLRGIGVAAFDTRISAKDVGRGLRLLMKIINYAAPRILKILTNKGGQAISSPEGFIVMGREGPLAEGETERASVWLKTLTGKKVG